MRSATRPASLSRADPYRRSAPSTHTTDYRDSRDPYARAADYGGARLDSYRRPPGPEYGRMPEGYASRSVLVSQPISRDRLGGGRRSSRDWDDREVDLREEVNRRAAGGDPYMSMRIQREYGPMDDYAFYERTQRERYDGMEAAYMRGGGDFSDIRFQRQGTVYSNLFVQLFSFLVQAVACMMVVDLVIIEIWILDFVI